MILIADSGSTKCDWVLLSDQSETSFSTSGINPVFHATEYIENILRNSDLLTVANAVRKVFFYGAGCSSKERKSIVADGLNSVFTNAEIVVDHDLTACAYATYDGEPSISCILGTGSNACYFDGKELTQAVPSLGYILGDEGGGSYFGKQLLTQFLYGRLPGDLQRSFSDRYLLTKEDIITRVYQVPNANTYLASFMEFMVGHASHPFVKEIIYQGFSKFNEFHVCSYVNYLDVKVHYVGSIAFLFSEELKRSCEDLMISVGMIIQKPIAGLVRYHQLDI